MSSISKNNFDYHPVPQPVQVAQEMYNLPPPGNMEQFLRLDVGGVKHATYWSTVKQYPEHRLAQLSPVSQHYVPSSNEYFFDRDPKVFEKVLNFYRTGKLHVDTSSCCFESLGTELEFWGLGVEHVSECCRQALYSQENKVLGTKRLQREVDNFILQEPKEQTGIRQYSFTHKMWLFLEDPTSSLLAMIWGIVFGVFVVGTVAVTCVETVPSCRIATDDAERLNASKAAMEAGYVSLAKLLATDLHPRIQVFDIILALIFSIEFAARFITSPAKLLLFKSVFNYIDVACIIQAFFAIAFRAHIPVDLFPAQLGVLKFYLSFSMIRFLRILRLLKLGRSSQTLKVLILGLKASLKDLLLVSILFSICLVLFSTLFHFSEFAMNHNHDHHLIQTPADGFWLAVITMTTVGYGDMVPQSAFQKTVASLCAISGVFIGVLGVGITAIHFSKYYTFLKKSQTQPIKI